ncbi:glycosyltransferase family 4 protein [Corynebacterium sp. Q4381]|uniref:glycosyltransferase family 4 protein n=1 Tax=Corynebacterium sp. Marseille-Q4381 TaxID=3121597 RepID=UPI002FE5C5CF
MKILIVTQYWFPENGVPQRRWQWLTQILAQEGHEVTVIAPPPSYNEEIDRPTVISLNRHYVGKTQTGPSGETIVRSGFAPARKTLTSKIASQAVGAGGQLRQVLRMVSPRCDNFDLVIGTVPALPTAFVTRVAALLLRAPYIIDLRDAWPDLLRNSEHWNSATGTKSLRAKLALLGPLQLTKAVTAWSINHSLRYAAGVMVTTRGMKDEILSDPRLRKASNNVAVIRNVFPAQTYAQRRRDNAERGNALRVLYAGTAGRAQNLGNALRAVRIARSLGVDVQLRVVGAGDARDRLEKLALQEDIPVQFYETKPAADLSEFYGWADSALVHLTDWEPLERTIPSKTYELMAQGIHITGVVSGEAAVLIQDMGAGDTVPPESPELLAQLWVAIARDRSRLAVSSVGTQWVRTQREEVVPKRFLELIEVARGIG